QRSNGRLRGDQRCGGPARGDLARGDRRRRAADAFAGPSGVGGTAARGVRRRAQGGRRLGPAELGLLEAAAGHLAPTLGAAQPLDEAADAPDVVELAIAEILQNGGEHQHEQVAGAREAPELELLEDERADADRDAEDEGERQEREEEFEAERAGRPEQRDEQISQQLEGRTEQVGEQRVAEAEHADRAIAAVQDHVAMAVERLERAALPAHALARQDAQTLRRLGPAHRLGNEADAVMLAALVHPAMDLDDDLQVLADRAVRVAADLDRDRAAEDAEGAG